MLQALERAVAAVVDHFGALNILVNNAQEVALGPLMSVSDEAFDAGWKSGPLATFRLMKLCYPHLKGGGSIINLGSTAAMRWDYAYYGTYACVKEAIRSLSRAAACEWARDGIRVNTILPCGDSPALMAWMGTAIAGDRDAFLNSIPLGRVGRCEEDIGRFAVLLCTDGCRLCHGPEHRRRRWPGLFLAAHMVRATPVQPFRNTTT